MIDYNELAQHWMFEEKMQPIIDPLFTDVERVGETYDESAVAARIARALDQVRDDRVTSVPRSEVVIEMPRLVAGLVAKIAHAIGRTEVLVFDLMLVASQVGITSQEPDERQEMRQVQFAAALRFTRESDTVTFNAVVNDDVFAVMRRETLVQRGAVDADAWVAAALVAFYWKVSEAARSECTAS